LVFASCGKEGKIGKIKVEVTPDSALVVGGDAQSCVDVLSGDPTTKSISGPRFNYRTIKISWSETDTLYINSLKVTGVSSQFSNVQYKCEIDGDELDALFKLTGTNKGGLIGGKKSITSATCGINCAVDLLEDPSSFSTNLEVKITGYAIDSDDQQYPVVGTANVTLENIGD
jgi:hypothetical protein